MPSKCSAFGVVDGEGRYNGCRVLDPEDAEDFERPRRNEWLNADPTVFSPGVVERSL